jgi:hypothetical protein
MAEYKQLLVIDTQKRMFYVKVNVLDLSGQLCDAGLSSPSVDFYHAMRYNNPEFGTVHSHCSENVTFGS